MSNDIVEKFTTHLKNVLTRALCFVVESQQPSIRPEHLLWALGTERGSVGAEILHKSKVKAEALRLSIGAPAKFHAEPPSPDAAVTPLLSENAKRAIEKAVLTASVYEHAYVGTEHLLSGLLQVRDDAVEGFLKREQVDANELRQHIAVVLKTASKFPELAKTVEAPAPDVAEADTDTTEETKRKTPALDFFGRDLTSPDLQAKIDPVIGRENEIQRVMEILCRRTKNNPLLLGEPGVGKTAIVEGLAKLVSEGRVPSALMGKRIVALDLALLIAGTMYRGEFEARLRQILDEVRANSDVILFVDEVHTIVGAGAATGSLDAANMLKPALARGEIRCIGATTNAEFKKHLETDAALERRFQPVAVHEPSADDTRRILEGIARYYEAFHRVRITPAARETAIAASVRYQPDKHLPDKAIDLLDEAASAARVRSKTPSVSDRRSSLERELAQLRDKKREAVAEENYSHALTLKEEEQQLLDRMEALPGEAAEPYALEISSPEVLEVVSRITGIALKELAATDRDRLLHLEDDLNARVIGQANAVRLVADAVRRAKTGVTHPERPLASFLFLGPSGVGKTELARAVADVVFQDKNALVRLDMSEFAEGYTVSKILGSPAGYVGYREPSKLTDAVKARPHSVVLFDEMEKAHPDVQNLLLQILENGEVTDATGRKINFRNAIIVLTSNVGLERLEGNRVGFSAGAAETESMLTEDLRRELEERFRPELVNRIDHVCVFKALGKDELSQIAKKQLSELSERLASQGLTFASSPQAIEMIAARAEGSKLRAREIRRLIQTEIESLVASHLLAAKPSKRFLVDWRENSFTLTTKR